jgi:hypothetical protein
MRTCEKCRYYSPSTKPLHGECTRYPPYPSSTEKPLTGFCRWPVVFYLRSCGEWCANNEEAVATSPNNRYATALRVIEEFTGNQVRCPYGVGVLTRWITQRLNAENSTSHS